jgi:branched-chain amino acid transport system ATP-binding protein
MSGLRLDDVTVRFGGVTAVEGVTFAVERSRVTGLVGPNGAGKTTVLQVSLAGFPSTAPTSRVSRPLGAPVPDWGGRSSGRNSSHR